MTRINLLPPEERAKASRERGLTLVVLALVVVVAILGLVFLYMNRQVSNRQADVDSVKTEIEQVNLQIAALKQYELLQTQRQQMSDTAKGIFDGLMTWSSICEELSLLIPDDCYLTALNATAPVEMQPGGSLAGAAVGAAATAAAPGALSVDITLTGKSLTHDTVAEFMTRLGLMPQITNIKLADSQKSTATAPTTGAAAQPEITFTINVSLRRFLVPPPLSAGVAPAAASGGAQ